MAAGKALLPRRDFFSSLSARGKNQLYLYAGGQCRERFLGDGIDIPSQPDLMSGGCRTHDRTTSLRFFFIVGSVATALRRLSFVLIFDCFPKLRSKFCFRLFRWSMKHLADNLDRQTRATVFGGLTDFYLLFHSEQLNHPQP